MQDSESNWQDVIDLHKQAQRNLELAIAALHEVQNRLAQAKISCQPLMAKASGLAPGTSPQKGDRGNRAVDNAL